MPTVHQRYRRTDGRTTYDSNTALCTTCIAIIIVIKLFTTRQHKKLRTKQRATIDVYATPHACWQVRGFAGANTSSHDLLNSSGTQRLAATTTTVLVTEATTLSSNPVYRIVYSNLLYFIVMFLVPLVLLLILNGELIRVLRDKKAKRAKLLQGRSRPASISAAAGQPNSVDPRR